MSPSPPPAPHAVSAAEGLLASLDTGALVMDASARARVRVVGADARAFLHRLSTNHVKDLGRGAGRLNVLPNDKGRIVDLVHHLDRGDDGVLLVGSPARGADLVAWLDRYLFSERVELEDATARGSAAEVAGGGAPAIVEALIPGAGALARWAFVEHGARLVVRGFDRTRADGGTVPAYLVVDLADPGVLAAVEARGAVPASQDIAERARIAAGVPGPGGELVERFNPLDLGLHDAIHWAKGCYIGQEVIARLDTYQKQTRRLVGLVLGPDIDTALLPGASVLVAGAVVGEVTSGCPSRRASAWGATTTWPSALAVAKLALEGPAPVQVKQGDAIIDALAVVPATAQAPHE